MLAKESADLYGKKVIFGKNTNKKCPKHTAAVRAHSTIYTKVLNLKFCQLPGSDRSLITNMNLLRPPEENKLFSRKLPFEDREKLRFTFCLIASIECSVS